ncbi:DNA primase, partial [Streptomyces cadmiisoli]
TLAGPDRVRIATHAYAATEDHIGRFLTECCTQNNTTETGNPTELRTELRTEQGHLYTAYSAWCSTTEGIRPANARVFAQRVRQEVGLTTPTDMIKSNGRKYYPGIALLSE